MEMLPVTYLAQIKWIILCLLGILLCQIAYRNIGLHLTKVSWSTNTLFLGINCFFMIQ